MTNGCVGIYRPFRPPWLLRRSQRENDTPGDVHVPGLGRDANMVRTQSDTLCSFGEVDYINAVLFNDMIAVLVEQ
jgi:hypothetical protein